ncbi:MAG: SM-20-related protein [Chitinophagales bacterium]
MQVLNEAQLDAFASDGILLLDNFLPHDIALSILSEAKEWQNLETFKKAGIGKLNQLVIHEEFRKDKIKWINLKDCKPATKVYADYLAQLMGQLSREFYLSLKDYESMYAVYPKGAYYKKHRDQFKQQPHRILSLVLYLNPDWKETDGGELVIYKDADSSVVSPIFNRVALFRSELFHEVLPCKAMRYSITSWMKDQLNEVYFL